MRCTIYATYECKGIIVDLWEGSGVPNTVIIPPSDITIQTEILKIGVVDEAQMVMNQIENNTQVDTQTNDVTSAVITNVPQSLIVDEQNNISTVSTQTLPTQSSKILDIKKINFVDVITITIIILLILLAVILLIIRLKKKQK